MPASFDEYFLKNTIYPVGSPNLAINESCSILLYRVSMIRKHDVIAARLDKIIARPCLLHFPCTNHPRWGKNTAISICVSRSISSCTSDLGGGAVISRVDGPQKRLLAIETTRTEANCKICNGVRANYISFVPLDRLVTISQRRVRF